MASAIVVAATLTFPCAAQFREHVQPAIDAAREGRKLNRADAALARLLRKHAPDLGLEDGEVSAMAELLKGWRTYTALECVLVGRVTGGSETYKSVYASMCEERRYAARTQVVSSATACLTRNLRKAPGDRRVSECLEPLTPLRADGDYEA